MKRRLCYLCEEEVTDCDDAELDDNGKLAHNECIREDARTKLKDLLEEYQAVHRA